MLFLQAAALLASLATSATAHVVRDDFAAAKYFGEAPEDWCGSDTVDDRLLEEYKTLNALSARQLSYSNSSSNSSASIVVDTYFHLVSNSTREEDGWLSNTTIVDQLQVLNDDYAPSGVKFRLIAVSRTVDPEWAFGTGNRTDLLEMKKALRQGDYKTLNLYFMTSPGPGLLGQCTFPDDFEPESDDFYQDGCILLQSTVPGGASVDADLGRTATHEVGHWFGLFHTFQGGCEGGDMVDDTPAQDTQSRGCQVGKDTCLDQEGEDPIHNFMDYSADSCVSEFTPGQTDRMHGLWSRFRDVPAGEVAKRRTARRHL